MPVPLCGRYRLEGRVAAGGMGEVWRARDTLLDRIVAVKLLRPEYAGSLEFRDRLRWEGRHAGLLSHPGVVQVHDYDDGSADGVPYLVMEYVEGPSLAAVLSEEGTLSPCRVLGLVAQAAEALACAHAAGIVHRDMKPGNVLVDGGQVKITDFGIARAVDAVPMTRTGLVIGTPAYLSPEQVAGRAATPASDLYGLGVIAYECLTGRPPFQGNALAVALAHRDRPLPPLPGTVPGPVAKLVAALTAKDPQRRPGDARAVAQWARRILASPQVAQASAGPVITGVSLIPPGPGGGVTRSLRHRLLRSSAAAVLLLLAVWAGWTAQHRFGDPPAAVSVMTRAGASGPGLVPVVPSAFYGIPAATAALRLQALGLRTQVRSVTAPGQPSGTVIGITPAGDVSPGTMITFYVAIALPAGPGHPLATTHQRLPGRHPLSARVMMFAVSGCFRRGMAGVSWSVTSQTARYRGQAIPGDDPALDRPSAHYRSLVMGIIAWIVLGLGAGLLASMLIPGRRSQGLVITCVIGVAGALLGGWLAIRLFHVVTLHGFFNVSTWLTAIAGAAILLLAYHLVTSRSAGRSRQRSRGWAHR